MVRTRQSFAGNSARFSSLEAEHRYFTILKNADCWWERGFPILRAPNLGLPDFVSGPIRHFGWTAFAEDPVDPILPLVREFYANYIDIDNEKVMVRGVPIDISEAAINQFFFLPDEEDFYGQTVNLLQPKHYKKILEKVGFPGAQWIEGPTHRLSIARAELLPESRIWLLFLLSRVSPTSSTTTVLAERIYLLYCVLRKKTINVGRLIRAGIAFSAEGQGRLYFPSLITGLCLNAGVVPRDSDEVRKNMAPIDKTSMTRIYNSPNPIEKRLQAPPSVVIVEEEIGHEPRTPTHTPAQTSEPKRPQEYEQVAVISRDEVLHLMNTVQQLHTQVCTLTTLLHKQNAAFETLNKNSTIYFGYQQLYNSALENALHINFPLPYPKFPPLPFDLLSQFETVIEHEDKKVGECSGVRKEEDDVVIPTPVQPPNTNVAEAFAQPVKEDQMEADSDASDEDFLPSTEPSDVEEDCVNSNDMDLSDDPLGFIAANDSD